LSLGGRGVLPGTWSDIPDGPAERLRSWFSFFLVHLARDGTEIGARRRFSQTTKKPRAALAARGFLLDPEFALKGVGFHRF